MAIAPPAFAPTPQRPVRRQPAPAGNPADQNLARFMHMVLSDLGQRAQPAAPTQPTVAPGAPAAPAAPGPAAGGGRAARPVPPMPRDQRRQAHDPIKQQRAQFRQQRHENRLDARQVRRLWPNQNAEMAPRPGLLGSEMEGF